MNALDRLTARLDTHGLCLRGGFTPGPVDQLPALPGDASDSSLLLVGNIGSSLWRFFRQSPEYKDGAAHPLDRWSRRIGDTIAGEFGGIALYPFNGPPFLPFLHWINKTEGLQASPLGLSIHPRYGLWHAYRFALLLPFALKPLTTAEATAHPCDQCLSKPCLDACPVDAFTGKEYKSDQCIDYLRSNRQSACMLGSCLARRACPVGQGYIYEAEHAQFHMQAFVKAAEIR
ncbi:MAG: hypothetical protein KDJ38_14105 [Gammaproteobacteria bacterium]|nr:hypothetical protein [Gammaproteobacteria bacterium]